MNNNLNTTKEPRQAQTGSGSYIGRHSRETSNNAIISKTSRFVKDSGRHSPYSP